MNAGNLLLGTSAIVLLGFGWMVMDVNSPRHLAATPDMLNTAFASDKPVLLEFYADWCGPCKMVGPMVENLALELHGQAEVLRFNVDTNQEMAAQYGVHGIPCFIAFRQGKEVARHAGTLDSAGMRAMMGL